MRAAIYARVSSEDQAKHGFSLPDQINECNRKAASLGALEAVNFIDDGVSGGTLERPALVRLRNEVAGGSFDMVVTLDPDRLSRDLIHLLLLTDEFEARNASVVFCTMEWQKTAEGRLFLSLRGAVAEFEKAKIRERMMRGKRQKTIQGGIAQAPTKLYGYRYEDGTLVPVSKEVEAVRRMFALSAEGLGTHRICARLVAEGYFPRLGDQWWPATVARILRNPVYAGNLRQFHKNRQGKDTVLVPAPAVIKPDLFALVQERLLEHLDHNPGRAGTGSKRLLSGLAKCGVCGSAIYSTSGYLPKDATRGYGYYTCGRRTKQAYGRKPSERCLNAPLPTQSIDDAVWGTVVDMLHEPDAAWLDRIARLRNENDATEAVDSLTMEIAELRAARDRILGLVLRGTIGQDEADKVLSRNTSALKRAQERMNVLRAAEAGRQRTAVDNIEEIRSLRSKAHLATDVEERRAVLRSLLKEIVIHPDRRVELVPASALLPTFNALRASSTAD